MNAFRLLNLRRLFEHPGRTTLSIAGIAIGAALVVAVLGLFGSLQGSVREFTEELAGVADLEVAAVTDAGFDEKLFFAIESTAGVEAAVPMSRTAGLVDRHEAIIVGLDQRAELLGTGLSRQESERLQSQATEPGIFMGRPLADAIGANEGNVVTIFAAGMESSWKLLAILEGESARLNQGMFAGTFLPLAQQMAAKVGRLDSVMVIAERGADLGELRLSLSETVGNEAAVHSLEQRAEQARLASQNLQGGMAMGAAMALTVGGFLIFNTMSMAANERRRELATLRALGGRRGPLLRLFLLEAAFIGLIGSVIGSALGLSLARVLTEALPTFAVANIGVELGFFMPQWAVPVAILIGITATVLAALVPSVRAVRVPPLESMRPEGVGEGADMIEKIAVLPTLVGAVLLVSGGGLAMWGPSSVAPLWVGQLMLGAIVLSYGLTGPTTKAASAIASKLGGEGRLAAAAVERAPRRAWATGAAVVVATAMVVAQSGLQRNLNDSLEIVLGRLQTIDLYVSATSGTEFASVQLPGDWSDDLSAIDGVKGVGTNIFFFVNFKGQKVMVQGLEGDTTMAVAAPALTGAAPDAFGKLKTTNAAIVSTRFSDLYGIEVGDTFELPTPTGSRRVEVVHSAPQFTWERGMITIARDKVQGWFGEQGVSDYGLDLEEGASVPAVRAAVTDFVSDAPLKVFVFTGQQQLEAIFQAANQIGALFESMTWVVVGAALLAIFNALLISVVERRRELGIMRAIGTSKRQVRYMVGIEAAGLGLVGGTSGAMLGLLLHRAAIVALAEPSGFPIFYEFIGWPIFLAVGVGIVIAILGGLLPARRAASVNIIEAIGYE